MENPLFTKFLKISHDYLVLLNSKIKRGELNKTVADEASTMEWYYNELESLFKEYEDRSYLNHLELIRERMTAKLLEKELSELIKASVSLDSEKISKAITNSNFDVGDVDLKKAVKFKKKEKPTDEKFKSIQDRFKKECPYRKY